MSRGVIVEAYSQLVAEGYLVARPGGATRVALAASPGAQAQPAPAAERPPRFDFRPGGPDVSLFPRDAWLASLRRALRSAPDVRLDYGDPRGAPELRGGARVIPRPRPGRRLRPGADDRDVRHGAGHGAARPDAGGARRPPHRRRGSLERAGPRPACLHRPRGAAGGRRRGRAARRGAGRARAARRGDGHPRSPVPAGRRPLPRAPCPACRVGVGDRRARAGGRLRLRVPLRPRARRRPAGSGSGAGRSTRARSRRRSRPACGSAGWWRPSGSPPA